MLVKPTQASQELLVASELRALTRIAVFDLAKFIVLRKRFAHDEELNVATAAQFLIE